MIRYQQQQQNKVCIPMTHASLHRERHKTKALSNPQQSPRKVRLRAHTRETVMTLTDHLKILDPEHVRVFSAINRSLLTFFFRCSLWTSCFLPSRLFRALRPMSVKACVESTLERRSVAPWCFVCRGFFEAWPPVFFDCSFRGARLRHACSRNLSVLTVCCQV